MRMDGSHDLEGMRVAERLGGEHAEHRGPEEGRQPDQEHTGAGNRPDEIGCQVDVLGGLLIVHLFLSFKKTPDLLLFLYSPPLPAQTAPFINAICGPA